MQKICAIILVSALVSSYEALPQKIWSKPVRNNQGQLVRERRQFPFGDWVPLTQSCPTCRPFADPLDVGLRGENIGLTPPRPPVTRQVHGEGNFFPQDESSILSVPPPPPSAIPRQPTTNGNFRNIQFSGFSQFNSPLPVPTQQIFPQTQQIQFLPQNILPNQQFLVNNNQQVLPVVNSPNTIFGQGNQIKGQINDGKVTKFNSEFKTQKVPENVVIEQNRPAQSVAQFSNKPKPFTISQQGQSFGLQQGQQGQAFGIQQSQHGFGLQQGQQGFGVQQQGQIFNAQQGQAFSGQAQQTFAGQQQQQQHSANFGDSILTPPPAPTNISQNIHIPGLDKEEIQLLYVPVETLRQRGTLQQQLLTQNVPQQPQNIQFRPSPSPGPAISVRPTDPTTTKLPVKGHFVTQNGHSGGQTISTVKSTVQPFPTTVTPSTPFLQQFPFSQTPQPFVSATPATPTTQSFVTPSSVSQKFSAFTPETTLSHLVTIPNTIQFSQSDIEFGTTPKTILNQGGFQGQLSNGKVQFNGFTLQQQPRPLAPQKQEIQTIVNQQGERQSENAAFLQEKQKELEIQNQISNQQIIDQKQIALQKQEEQRRLQQEQKEKELQEQLLLKQRQQKELEAQRLLQQQKQKELEEQKFLQQQRQKELEQQRFLQQQRQKELEEQRFLQQQRQKELEQQRFLQQQREKELENQRRLQIQREKELEEKRRLQALKQKEEEQRQFRLLQQQRELEQQRLLKQQQEEQQRLLLQRQKLENTKIQQQIPFYEQQQKQQFPQQVFQQGTRHTLPANDKLNSISQLEKETEPEQNPLVPHQPPLSVFYKSQKPDTRIIDVLRELRSSSTITVLDQYFEKMPKVFVGPAGLVPPAGYGKFELPYLSNIEANSLEKKIDRLPFFVAPLNFIPPPGYAKIPFPAPHVGSVVVSSESNPAMNDKQVESEHSQGSVGENESENHAMVGPELPGLINGLEIETTTVRVTFPSTPSLPQTTAQLRNRRPNTNLYKNQSRKPISRTRLTTTPRPEEEITQPITRTEATTEGGLRKPFNRFLHRRRQQSKSTTEAPAKNTEDSKNLENRFYSVEVYHNQKNSNQPSRQRTNFFQSQKLNGQSDNSFGSIDRSTPGGHGVFGVSPTPDLQHVQPSGGALETEEHKISEYSDVNLQSYEDGPLPTGSAKTITQELYRPNAIQTSSEVSSKFYPKLEPTQSSDQFSHSPEEQRTTKFTEVSDVNPTAAFVSSTAHAGEVSQQFSNVQPTQISGFEKDVPAATSEKFYATEAPKTENPYTPGSVTVSGQQYTKGFGSSDEYSSSFADNSKLYTPGPTETSKEESSKFSETPQPTPEISFHLQAPFSQEYSQEQNSQEFLAPGDVRPTQHTSTQFTTTGASSQQQTVDAINVSNGQQQFSGVPGSQISSVAPSTTQETYKNNFGVNTNSQGTFRTHFGTNANPQEGFNTNFGGNTNRQTGFKNNFGTNTNSQEAFKSSFGTNINPQSAFRTQFGANTQEGIKTQYGTNTNTQEAFQPNFRGKTHAQTTFRTHFGTAVDNEPKTIFGESINGQGAVKSGFGIDTNSQNSFGANANSHGSFRTHFGTNVNSQGSFNTNFVSSTNSNAHEGTRNSEEERRPSFIGFQDVRSTPESAVSVVSPSATPTQEYFSVTPTIGSSQQPVEQIYASATPETVAEISEHPSTESHISESVSEDSAQINDQSTEGHGQNSGDNLSNGHRLKLTNPSIVRVRTRVRGKPRGQINFAASQTTTQATDIRPKVEVKNNGHPEEETTKAHREYQGLKTKYNQYRGLKKPGRTTTTTESTPEPEQKANVYTIRPPRRPLNPSTVSTKRIRRPTTPVSTIETATEGFGISTQGYYTHSEDPGFPPSGVSNDVYYEHTSLSPIRQKFRKHFGSVEHKSDVVSSYSTTTYPSTAQSYLSTAQVQEEYVQPQTQEEYAQPEGQYETEQSQTVVRTQENLDRYPEWNPSESGIDVSGIVLTTIRTTSQEEQAEIEEPKKIQDSKKAFDPDYEKKSGRRRVRVRVHKRPHENFETAESQNLRTVANVLVPPTSTYKPNDENIHQLAKNSDFSFGSQKSYGVRSREYFKKRLNLTDTDHAEKSKEGEQSGASINNEGIEKLTKILGYVRKTEKHKVDHDVTDDGENTTEGEGNKILRTKHRGYIRKVIKHRGGHKGTDAELNHDNEDVEGKQESGEVQRHQFKVSHEGFNQTGRVNGTKHRTFVRYVKKHKIRPQGTESNVETTSEVHQEEEIQNVKEDTKTVETPVQSSEQLNEFATSTSEQTKESVSSTSEQISGLTSSSGSEQTSESASSTPEQEGIQQTKQAEVSQFPIYHSTEQIEIQQTEKPEFLSSSTTAQTKEEEIEQTEKPEEKVTQSQTTQEPGPGQIFRNLFQPSKGQGLRFGYQQTQQTQQTQTTSSPQTQETEAYQRPKFFQSSRPAYQRTPYTGFSRSKEQGSYSSTTEQIPEIQDKRDGPLRPKYGKGSGFGTSGSEKFGTTNDNLSEQQLKNKNLHTLEVRKYLRTKTREGAFSSFSKNRYSTSQRTETVTKGETEGKESEEITTPFGKTTVTEEEIKTEITSTDSKPQTTLSFIPSTDSTERAVETTKLEESAEVPTTTETIGSSEEEESSEYEDTEGTSTAVDATTAGRTEIPTTTFRPTVSQSAETVTEARTEGETTTEKLPAQNTEIQPDLYRFSKSSFSFDSADKFTGTINRAHVRNITADIIENTASFSAPGLDKNIVPSTSEESSQTTVEVTDNEKTEEATTEYNTVEPSTEYSESTDTETTSATESSTKVKTAKLIKTSTTTKISHETEICYKGKCIRTKSENPDDDLKLLVDSANIMKIEKAKT